MKNIDNYFAFSFGGNCDFGQNQAITQFNSINFPVENPTGYGFSVYNTFEQLRRGGTIIFEVSSTEDLLITKEAPPFFIPSNERIEKNKKQKITINSIENTNEVKIFISKRDNMDLAKCVFIINKITLL